MTKDAEKTVENSATEKEEITLRSSDDKEFVVDLKIAKLSETIKTMLDTLGSQDSEDNTPIPITKVTSGVLEKVIEWGEYHKDRAHLEDEEEEQDEKKYDPYEFDKDYKIEIGEWDQEFFKRAGLEMTFEILMAANYLDIKGLLNLTCKVVANMIKGRSPKEIAEYFAPLREKNLKAGKSFQDPKAEPMIPTVEASERAAAAATSEAEPMAE